MLSIFHVPTGHLYVFFAADAAKSLQSCPTLCDPTDGSPVPGILQARTLEWVAISFSNAWKWKGKVKSFNRVWLLATPGTVAYQAPSSMGFFRQEYSSGVPLPSPCVLWRRVYFLPIFLFFFFFLLLNCMSCLWFWILSIYLSYHLQIFSPILYVVFSFFMISFDVSKHKFD